MTSAPRPWFRRREGVAGFFLFTGVAHLTFARRFFEAIVPPWAPFGARRVNIAAGYAEMAVGASALVPGAERHARRAIVAVLLGVYPANLDMALRPHAYPVAKGVPRWLLFARLPLQFVFVAWVLGAVRRDDER